MSVVRLEPGLNGRSKDYFPLSVWQDSVTGKREWRWKNLPAPRPLYGLDQLAARTTDPVVVCEGEKAADAAAKLLPDHVAVCWMNGAEAVSKADFSPLSGRDCLIWPDNDQPGADAAQAVATALQKVGAASVARVDLSGFAAFVPSEDGGKLVLVEGGQWSVGDDAADALARGWTAGHIELLRASGQWLVLDATAPVQANPGTANSTSNTSVEKFAKAEKPNTSRTKKSAPKRPTTESAGSPFHVTDSGVWFKTEDMDAPLWICAKLEILAHTRDQNGENWGILVRFSDRDGITKEWNIPAEKLATVEGADVFRELKSRGLKTGSGPKARQRLIEYLERDDCVSRATIVARLGWHNGVFLLPDGQLGECAEMLVFQASTEQRKVMQVAGTLADWQEQVARYCVGNHRFAFGVSAAFAGPIMDIVGAESGGFNFYGDSSQGKTTLLQTACSVFGSPGYMQTWRQTDNCLENVAAAYSGCLLALDELKQCDPRIVGETVMMLGNGNGKGKGRANERGGSRGGIAAWNVMFLSSGEKTLAAHMATVGKKTDVGMDVRMLEIPADPGAGLGLFDVLHDKPTGTALTNHLKAACSKYYGTAARAFISRLVSERLQQAATIIDQVSRFVREVVPDEAHGQIHRAAARFALVAVAGEMASAWGVTGWPKNVAWDAAKVCFADWLKARGTVGNAEDEAIKARIRLRFEMDGESRFTRLSTGAILYEADGKVPDPDDHAPKTISRLGYRMRDPVSGLIKYYVLPEAFRQEICAGLDVNRVCRLLAEMGALETTTGAGNMLQTRITPEAKSSKSGRAKVYCVTSAIYEQGTIIDDGEETSYD